MTKLVITAVIFYAVGILVGVLVREHHPKRYDGEFVINLVDPEKDTYRLTLFTPFPMLPTKKSLSLRIRNENMPYNDR